MRPYKIWKDIYIVGGAEISHPQDCSVYLINTGDLVLIDCGAGKSFNKINENINSLGFDSKLLKAIIVTHAHIDHIGSLHQFQKTLDLQVVAHELDTTAIEQGVGTGAEAYGVYYNPCKVDTRVKGSEQRLQLGKYKLNMIHIPGHTPGSIAVYVDMDEKRVLFGQDIHGPYYPEWGADPAQAKTSLQKLIDLKADILCEGHFGIYQPSDAVEEYIREYLEEL
jgi:glyoxylase-like metal-dependent hydrolase (beta-lactamase superfamily II)